MESQGSGAKQNSVTGAIHPVTTIEFYAQRSPIPPSSFLQGFGGAGNHLPFLYPHSFMPPILGFGFRAPTQCTPSATIDLTEGSQKKKAPKNPSLTSPSQTKNGEPPGRKRTLSIWTTRKKMRTSWRMLATGRTTGWFNSSHFGERCKTPSVHRQSKVCFFSLSFWIFFSICACKFFSNFTTCLFRLRVQLMSTIMSKSCYSFAAGFLTRPQLVLGPVCSWFQKYSQQLVSEMQTAIGFGNPNYSCFSLCRL